MAAELEDLGKRAIELSEEFRIAGHPTLGQLLLVDAHRFLAKAKAARQSGVQERFGDPALLLTPQALGEAAELQPIPDYLVRVQERAEKLGFQFAPIFYPDLRLFQHSDFWKGKIKPEDRFWKGLSVGEFTPESAILNGNWALIETVQKPGSGEEIPEYYEGNDPIADLLITHRYSQVRPFTDVERPYSRFNISAAELEESIFPLVSGMLEADGIQVGLPRYVEYNAAGNILCPEWGLTDKWEVLADGPMGREVRLMGGHTQNGGLATVDFIGAKARNEEVGFRMQIVERS